MAGANDKTASFPIVLDDQVSRPASDAANALDGLRKRIEGGQQSIKELTSAQRALKGSTEDVKEAREELKTRLQTEKNALAQASLALLKQGTSYEKAAAEAKKLEEQKRKLEERTKKEADSEKKATAAAIKLGGGPLSSLKDKVSSVKEAFEGGNVAASALTLAVGGLIAAVAALTVATIAGAVAIGKWVIESANAERTLRLTREAVTGSAEGAKNLGDQIALTATKVSLSRDKLNDLNLSLAKTRLSGQAQVDTFNLVAQAADGMGDDVGNALKDIATRAQTMQRFQLSPQELFGKGISFEDVAGNLAKQMNVGIGEAKSALFDGRVKLDDGVKALRTTVEKRFASINAKKALDINVQVDRMREGLVRMTRDVNLEPLNQGFAEIAKNFDESTVTGAALHTLITKLGDVMATTFGAGAPLVHKFVQGLEIGALTGAIAFLKMKKALDGAFGKETVDELNLAGIALSTAKFGAEALAAGVIAAYTAFRIFTKEVKEARDALNLIFTGKQDDTKSAGAKMGTSFVAGLIEGMVPGGELAAAVGNLARSVKEKFAGDLGIHSPSRVFAEYGEQTVEGYSQGVDRRAPDAQASVAAMVPAPPAAGASARASGGGVVMHVHLHAEAGANPETVRALQEPSFIAKFRAVVDEVLSQTAGGATVGG